MSVGKYFSKSKRLSDCYAVHLGFFLLFLLSSSSSLTLHPLKDTGQSCLHHSWIMPLMQELFSSLLSLLAKLSEPVPIIKSLSHFSFPSLHWWSSISYCSLYCKLTIFSVWFLQWVMVSPFSLCSELFSSFQICHSASVSCLCLLIFLSLICSGLSEWILSFRPFAWSLNYCVL